MPVCRFNLLTQQIFDEFVFPDGTVAINQNNLQSNSSGITNSGNHHFGR